MIYSLLFLPEVEEDIIAGYVWYEGKSPGLGEEFLPFEDYDHFKRSDCMRFGEEILTKV
jgi:hypothetical protein